MLGAFLKTLKTKKLIKEIKNELIRLKVSIEDDIYSGIGVRKPHLYKKDTLTVYLYDSDAGFHCDGSKVLKYLRSLDIKDASLSMEDKNYIWNLLVQFEISRRELL